MPKVDSLIRMLLPKEERFHELLGKDTENLVRGVKLFSEIARTADLEDRRVKAVELKAIEHEGDSITRQVFDALNSSFITPFDRDDIRSLTMDLDDILDYLEAVAQYLVILELAESTPALQQFAAILVAMV
jgi:hypothetical protein